jgi:hypothetical protein
MLKCCWRQTWPVRKIHTYCEVLYSVQYTVSTIDYTVHSAQYSEGYCTMYCTIQTVYGADSAVRGLTSSARNKRHRSDLPNKSDLLKLGSTEYVLRSTFLADLTYLAYLIGQIKHFSGVFYFLRYILVGRSHQHGLVHVIRESGIPGSVIPQRV